MHGTPGEIRWSDELIDLQIDFNSLESMPDVDVVRFRGLLLALDEVVPLAHFRILMVGEDPLSFQYDFVADNRRPWVQNLYFDGWGDSNPSMTFSIAAPGWRLSEFRPHRDLRALVVHWVNRYRLHRAEAAFK